MLHLPRTIVEMYESFQLSGPRLDLLDICMALTIAMFVYVCIYRLKLSVVVHLEVVF